MISKPTLIEFLKRITTELHFAPEHQPIREWFLELATDLESGALTCEEACDTLRPHFREIGIDIDNHPPRH